MSLIYKAMYSVGFTPWESDVVPAELRSAVEGADRLDAEAALDIGCGTGAQAVYLAKHGWSVTALDVVEKPLHRARQRANAVGVSIDFIQADVTTLADLRPDARFTLLHDRGCFHGLNEPQRDAYACATTATAAPEATLLIMAFARNRKLGGPPGVTQEELQQRFSPEWEIVSAIPDTAPPPAGPMRKVPRTWYRLTRRQRA